MGLLTKITNTTAELKPCFSTFCKKYGFVHAGVFSIVDGMYILTKAFSLDAETVLHSVSSPDFWKGSIPSSSCWHTFSSQQENLTGFYQFFSTPFKSKLSTIHFLSFTFNARPYVFSVMHLEGEAITIPLPEITPTFLYELSQACSLPSTGQVDRELIKTQIAESLSLFPATLLTISFDNTFKQFSEQGAFITVNLCTQAQNTILDELAALIERTFAGIHIAVPAKNSSFHVAFFSSQNLDADLMHFQIAQTCKPIIGTLFNSTISVSISETTQSSETIQNFLLAE